MTAPLQEDMRITVLRCPGCGAEAHAARAFDPIAGPPGTGRDVIVARLAASVGPADAGTLYAYAIDQFCPQHAGIRS